MPEPDVTPVGLNRTSPFVAQALASRTSTPMFTKHVTKGAQLARAPLELRHMSSCSDMKILKSTTTSPIGPGREKINPRRPFRCGIEEVALARPLFTYACFLHTHGVGGGGGKHVVPH